MFNTTMQMMDAAKRFIEESGATTLTRENDHIADRVGLTSASMEANSIVKFAGNMAVIDKISQQAIDTVKDLV